MYIRIRRSLVETAADELETCAHELQVSHTVNGSWPDEESEAKQTYDFYTNLISLLREALK